MSASARQSIGDLPAELLVEIFSRSCCSWQPDLQHTQHCPRNALLVACAAVCQRWRSVTLESPLLWTHIHATFRPNRLTIMHFVRLQLQRSAAAPLTVTLHFRTDDPWSYGILDEMLRLHVPRIERFVLHDECAEAAAGSHLRNLFAFHRGFPRLRSLRIYHSTHTRGRVKETNLFFDKLPALQSLTLGMQSHPILRQATASFAHLRELELAQVSAGDVLSVLPQLAAGTHLQITSCRGSNRAGVIPTSTPIAALTINHCTPYYIRLLLEKLTAPRLTKLHLWSDTHPDTFRVLAPFFTRSGARLTHLSTGFPYSSEEPDTNPLRVSGYQGEFFAFLASGAAAHVVELTVAFLRLQAVVPLLEMLADVDTGTGADLEARYLPALRVLALRSPRGRFNSDVPSTERAILRLVEARYGLGLRELWVDDWDKLLSVEMQRRLRKTGLVVGVFA
ncbi:hypothetical protein MKEN_01327000 [Mycena kentingensis (nom. inval.)]|nr:hypothetical protein MKEN_01327000 [Mycena kentingensis (nom. inval.)]